MKKPPLPPPSQLITGTPTLKPYTRTQKNLNPANYLLFPFKQILQTWRKVAPPESHGIQKLLQPALFHNLPCATRFHHKNLDTHSQEKRRYQQNTLQSLDNPLVYVTKASTTKIELQSTPRHNSCDLNHTNKTKIRAPQKKRRSQQLLGVEIVQTSPHPTQKHFSSSARVARFTITKSELRQPPTQ